MTEKEFNSIFEQYRMPIFYFVRKLSNDTYGAEEITSIVFIKLWENQPVFLTDAKTKAWLFLSAKRTTLDYIKSKEAKSKFYQPLIEDEDITDYDIEEADRVEIYSLVIKQIIKLLSRNATEREQLIFKLHLLDGIPIPQIAIMLGTKQQTISNQLLAIRNKIRSNIKNPNQHQTL